jgi:hypothetical protein
MADRKLALIRSDGCSMSEDETVYSYTEEMGEYKRGLLFMSNNPEGMTDLYNLNIRIYPYDYYCPDIDYFYRSCWIIMLKIKEEL